MVVLASITESLVTFATNVVHDVGLPGVFLLMLLESACIPIPSEATMLFAGFSVSTHNQTLLGITAAGVLGNLVGSWIAYGVGALGRLELLERHGRVIHVTPARLAAADRWFARHGSASVFVCRLLPVVRTFISLPAGVARMPLARFTLLTVAGCAPFVFALGLIGDQVGSRWRNWKDALGYVDYVMAALVVVGVLWLIVALLRRDSGASAADLG